MKLGLAGLGAIKISRPFTVVDIHESMFSGQSLESEANLGGKRASLDTERL